MKKEKKNRKILPAKNAPHLPGGVSVFLAIVVVLQLMFFLLHFMIYETLVAAFGGAALWLGVPLFILSLTFVTASILAAKYKSWVVQAYYKVAGIWVSFIAPFCGACFGFVIIENVLPFAGIDIPSEIAGAILFGIAIAITVYGIWNGTRAQVTRITVALANLPEFWVGKKVVFFSDVHLGAFWGRGMAMKIARKTNALAPAAVLIGGDIFDGVKCDTDVLLEPFKKIAPPLGIFAVTGNHEYIRDSETFLAALRRSNIRLLETEHIDLHGIQLLGVDYNDSAKKENFTAALDRLEIDKSKPSILLKHVPDALGAAVRAGVSLTLMGHTHRGQFWPLSLITRHIYEGFDYGQNQLGEMKTYTSSGVGGWMSPFRFGTKSEIVEIELIAT